MPAANKIKVLIVEDSNVVRALIEQILNSDPRIQVIGRARNGYETLQFLARQRPDVILMDIDIPEMDAREAIQRILETRPLPIIICTCLREATAALAALELGAVACVEKPPARHDQRFATAAAQLLEAVKLMSEIKVVHRWPRSRRNAAGTITVTAPPPVLEPTNINIVGMGASTGGPPVLKTILEGLGDNFSAPVLVVQHISRGFLKGLVDWLNQTTNAHVEIATDGSLPEPGRVYLAPDDLHMETSIDGRISLVAAERENNLRPSVSRLFRSLAQEFGPSSVGVLLTGMGKDGARELKLMRDRGATTIAQDRETSAVHGMPGEAIAIGGATHVLPAERIAPALLTLVHHHTLCQGASL